MIKEFNELANLEVKITKKPTFKWNKAKQKFERQEGKDIDTLSWYDCLKALYENGAKKVEYENILNSEGGLVFVDKNDTAHIQIWVDVDGDKRTLFYPLIDGSKNIELSDVTQSDIYNAKQRAFVKCVAINWGLGLSIFNKNSDEDEQIINVPKNISIYEKLRNYVNTGVKKLGSIEELEKVVGFKEKTIKELISNAEKIDEILKTIEPILCDEK